MRKAKLIPPDRNQCQAMIRSGCHPNATEFMKIGPARQERCTAEPVVIVTEKRPGADGQRGSMSLCRSCQATFKHAFGENYATETPIKDEQQAKKTAKKA